MIDLVVYGTATCADCKRTKQFLDTQLIPYTYLDIETNSVAMKDMLTLTNDSKVIPVVVKDGKMVQEPTNNQLKEFLGIV